MFATTHTLRKTQQLLYESTTWADADTQGSKGTTEVWAIHKQEVNILWLGGLRRKATKMQHITINVVKYSNVE